MGEMIDKATEEGPGSGIVFDIHQKNILLPRVFDAAKELAKEIYDEVILKGRKSYTPTDNELLLLAFVMIWSAWSAWVFKSKSENPNRLPHLQEVAKADF